MITNARHAEEAGVELKAELAAARIESMTDTAISVGLILMNPGLTDTRAVNNAQAHSIPENMFALSPSTITT